MPNWTDNTIMTWDGTKVSDHGRSPLSVSTQRIGSDRRMADGTLRRHQIRVVRTWELSWDNLPSIVGPSGFIKPVDGGMSGRDMEDFFYSHPGKFRMVIRTGSASGKSVPNPAESSLPYEDNDFYIANVMITDFSHEVSKRGPVDLWRVNITLEEV